MKKQTLFILISFICISLIILGFYFLDKLDKKLTNNPEINENINKDNEVNKNDNDKEELEDPYKEYKKYKNFKLENLNRYIEYQNKYPTLTIRQSITRVNLNLDEAFYTSVKNSKTEDGILILVNKYNKLGSSYEPNDLEEISQEYFIYGNTYVREMRKEAKDQFEKLSKASIENGTPVYGQSAYREYSQQENLYKNAVNEMGQEAADNDTARPGHSEHQTGLTIDVSSTKNGNMLNFGNTSSFKWMQENAHKYGFILRYPEGYEDIHGFMYESWHYRYIGVEHATNMYENYKDLTYDEYYDEVIRTSN